MEQTWDDCVKCPGMLRVSRAALCIADDLRYPCVDQVTVPCNDKKLTQWEERLLASSIGSGGSGAVSEASAGRGQEVCRSVRRLLQLGTSH